MKTVVVLGTGRNLPQHEALFPDFSKEAELGLPKLAPFFNLALQIADTGEPLHLFIGSSLYNCFRVSAPSRYLAR